MNDKNKMNDKICLIMNFGIKFLMSIFINFYYPYVAIKLKKKYTFYLI